MRSSTSHTLAPAAALTLTLAISGCGGGAAVENTGPPPATDTTPPFTQAAPHGGLYPALQLVTLTADESATIHYTTDGSRPTPDLGTTVSGSSPITGIVVDHPLTLKFYGVDDEGNEESLRTEEYTFDTDPPNLFLGTYTGTVAMLEVGEVDFVTDESGIFRVEIGGNGEPGSGESLVSGQAAANVYITVEVPGWRLEQGVTNELWIYVHDAAGGYGSLPVHVDSVPAESFPVPGECGDLVTDADGRYLYLARPQESAVWCYDVDPLSPSCYVLKQVYDVDPHPRALALLVDDEYLYVTCDARLDEVELATGAVTSIPIPGGAMPSDVAVLPEPKTAYVACGDMRIRAVDLDRNGGALHAVEELVTGHPFETAMTAAYLAINPPGSRMVIAWTGDVDYGAVVLDVDPSSDYYHFVRGTLVDAVPMPVLIGIPAVGDDGDRAWLGSGTGRLASATLLSVPAALVATSPSLGVRAVTPTPDGQLLFLHGGSLNGIRLVDPETLELVGTVSSGGAAGTGETLGFSPDGRRAYLVRQGGTPQAEVWVPRLYQ